MKNTKYKVGDLVEHCDKSVGLVFKVIFESGRAIYHVFWILDTMDDCQITGQAESTISTYSVGESHE